MEIFCKLDHLQRTGSFKERGARNALALLPAEQKKRGVIAASAGNHAQALAYQGKLLGVPATVVMPKFAPLIKMTNCQKLGATWFFTAKILREAKTHAHEIAEETSWPTSMATTIRRSLPDKERWGSKSSSKFLMSMLSSCPSAAVVYWPEFRWPSKRCGRRSKWSRVEAENVASFSAALEAGKPTGSTMHPTLADGLAIPQVGANAFEIAQVTCRPDRHRHAKNKSRSRFCALWKWKKASLKVPQPHRWRHVYPDSSNNSPEKMRAAALWRQHRPQCFEPGNRTRAGGRWTAGRFHSGHQ